MVFGTILETFRDPGLEAIFQNLATTMDLESSRGAILEAILEAIWAPNMGTLLRPDAPVRANVTGGLGEG